MARTKQDYETPSEFFRACDRRFGPITLDLAADDHNHKADKYINKYTDTFSINWHKFGGVLWLNSEFNNLDEYAAKCMREAKQGARIVQLCPASVGSNWYADCAYEYAHTMPIRPRLIFVGCSDPYPKDLMLLLWNMGERYPIKQITPWRWM